MKNEHTKFYTVTLATAPIGLLAVIAKITKPSNIYKTVNRNGNRHEVVSDGHYHVYRIKGSSAAITAEVTRRCELFAELPLEVAVTALAKGFERHHIKTVPAGQFLEGLHVSGTYFGSGSYSANFLTNGDRSRCKEHSRDTKFAMENFHGVILNAGDYLLQWVSASPGSSYKTLYIAA